MDTGRDTTVHASAKLELKGVTAKMSMSLSISGRTLVMESPKLGPRVKLFQ